MPNKGSLVSQKVFTNPARPPARFPGGFAKSHEPTHNQNFVKEPNYPPTSSFKFMPDYYLTGIFLISNIRQIIISLAII
jgi:hypothetical protein